MIAEAALYGCDQVPFSIRYDLQMTSRIQNLFSDQAKPSSLARDAFAAIVLQLNSINMTEPHNTGPVDYPIALYDKFYISRSISRIVILT